MKTTYRFVRVLETICLTSPRGITVTQLAKSLNINERLVRFEINKMVARELIFWERLSYTQGRPAKLWRAYESGIDVLNENCEQNETKT